MGNIQFYNEKILFTPDHKVAMHEDCCCDVACSKCAGGSGPDEWQVVLSGIADGYSCNECDENFNDTFTLTWWQYDGAYQACKWRYIFPSPFCSGTFDRITLWVRANEIRVWLGHATGNHTAFYKAYGSLPDCTVENESLTSKSVGDAACNYDSASCVLSAL